MPNRTPNSNLTPESKNIRRLTDSKTLTDISKFENLPRCGSRVALWIGVADSVYRKQRMHHIGPQDLRMDGFEIFGMTDGWIFQSGVGQSPLSPRVGRTKFSSKMVKNGVKFSKKFLSTMCNQCKLGTDGSLMNYEGDFDQKFDNFWENL